ncbi:MAG: hypothetical protein ACU0BF_00665 [Paracoccaceae bacterium]
MALGPTGPNPGPRVQSRARPLGVGITDVDRWRREDEAHLPPGGPAAPAFVPEPRPLDAVLRRETLDERLSSYLVPADIDPDLLAPAVMAQTREGLRARFARAAEGTAPGSALPRALALLSDEVTLDHEVRAALAALLRG